MLLRCRLTRTTLFPYTTLFRSTLGIPTVGAGTRGPGNQGTTQTREPVTQGPGGTFYHARNILSLLASHLSTSQRLEQISAWAWELAHTTTGGPVRAAGVFPGGSSWGRPRSARSL